LSVILAQSLAALLYFQQSIMIDQLSRLNNVPAMNNFQLFYFMSFLNVKT